MMETMHAKDLEVERHWRQTRSIRPETTALEGTQPNGRGERQRQRQDNSDEREPRQPQHTPTPPTPHVPVQRGQPATASPISHISPQRQPDTAPPIPRRNLLRSQVIHHLREESR